MAQEPGTLSCDGRKPFTGTIRRYWSISTTEPLSGKRTTRQGQRIYINPISLVLDYELDKAKREDGTQAIDIIKRLMKSKHFNLVIVYTNQPLEQVFQTVRWSLLGPRSNHITSEELDMATSLVEDAEAVSEEQDVWKRISATVNSEQYFHSRLHSSTYLRTMVKIQEPYGRFFRFV